MVVRLTNWSTRHEDTQELTALSPPSRFRQTHNTFHLVATACLLLVAMLGPSSTASAAGPALIDPRTLVFDTIELVPLEPDRIVLNNGLVIYLLEDHELPLITISALIRTGSWLDPPDKVGLAALTGTVMRTGGSGGFSAAQLEEELAQVGGRMTITIGRQSGSASLDILKKDVENAIRVFAGAIRKPAFDSASVELAKLQAVERIRRREDEPDSVASREFTKLLYGAGHPAAREGSIESLARITKDDLIEFHRKTIHPNGIILGVSGDLMKDEMAALVQEAFGDWEMGPVPELRVADVPEPEAERAVIHFIKKDTAQTHLRAGRLSVRETDPDYVPLVVANDIFGGDAFVGRLYNEVRTKRGLAYSVGSELRTGLYNQSMWLVWAETKLPSTMEVLGQLEANLTRMRTELVSDAELRQAKEAWANSSVFDFSSPSKIVSRLMKLEYDGLPKDFYHQLRKNILKVSKEDILAVGRKYLRLDQLKIVAVGSGETLSKELSTFGDVKEITLNDHDDMHAVMTSELCFDSSQGSPSCAP